MESMATKVFKIFFNPFRSFQSKVTGFLMGDGIGSGLSSKSVCFDFCSIKVVQLSNRNPYFYRFRCHHPLLTQLRMDANFGFVPPFLWHTVMRNYIRAEVDVFSKNIHT